MSKLHALFIQWTKMALPWELEAILPTAYPHPCRCWGSSSGLHLRCSPVPATTQGKEKWQPPPKGPPPQERYFPFILSLLNIHQAHYVQEAALLLHFLKNVSILKNQYFFFLWISAMPSWALWRELLREPHRWKPQQLRARAWRAAFRSLSLLWPLMNV